MHTDSNSFKNVQINLHRKSTMKIACCNVFNLPTLKGTSKTTYKYAKKLRLLLWEKKIPIWIFNLQIWWDIVALCIHGITSNLISKGCETREPSAYALIELETELISLQQWLDLSNINAQVVSIAIPLSKPCHTILDKWSLHSAHQNFQTMAYYDELQKKP